MSAEDGGAPRFAHPTVRIALALAWLLVSLVPLVVALVVSAVFIFRFEHIPDSERALWHSLAFYTGLLGAANTGAYLTFIWRGSSVPPTRRVLWTFGILIYNFWVMPLFWYWYVWRAWVRQRGPVEARDPGVSV